MTWHNIVVRKSVRRKVKSSLAQILVDSFRYPVYEIKGKGKSEKLVPRTKKQ